jgi:hypothetical protein
LSTSSLSRFLSALSQNSQLYDPLHQTPINSISRPLLSSTILSHAQSHANITVLFDHKVAKIDWKRRIVYRTASGFKGGWEDPSEGQNEGAGKGWDLMVGSDGIWSAVRGEMMKVSPCAAFPVLSTLVPVLLKRFVSSLDLLALPSQIDLFSESDPPRLDRASPSSWTRRPVDW